MRRLMRTGLLALLLISGCATSEPGDEDLRPAANRLVAEANQWKQGDRIPPHMLELREPDEDGHCLGLVTDTQDVFERVTNYTLFLELIPRANERLLEYAAERAVLLAGPSRFYADLLKLYAARPDLIQRPEHREFRRRTTVSNAWVVGLFIRHKDMAEEERKSVLAGIAKELNRGESWDAVYDRHFRRYEYVETEGINKGSTLTKIGNYGDFVISPSRRSGRPFRSTEVAEDHVAALLAAKKGEVLILDDENEEWTLLYQVLESYTPAK
jgi:hypothetical protein